MRDAARICGAVNRVRGRLSGAPVRHIAVALSFTLGLSAAPLRVCADPDNLPYSNRNEQGLENRLAKLLAHELGTTVEFTWWEQRRNFIEKSLQAGACDAIMGVPATIPDIAVTQPYYTSTYVWVEKRGLKPEIASLYDPRLKTLRIGAHIVDDSYAPPAQALAQGGLAANLVGFSLYGEHAAAPAPAHLISAVSSGDVDIALAWGPLAGYFAGGTLALVPVTPPRVGMLPFVYAIAIGVRKNEAPLRDKLDAALTRQCAAIAELLQEYRFPLANERRMACASGSLASASSELR